MRSNAISPISGAAWRTDRPRGFVDGEAETCREADGAQHAELVLGQARGRITDRAHDAASEVLGAADVVDDTLRDRIEEHAVDGEIPPPRVLLGAAEVHLDRMARVEIDAVAAERRHLDALRSRRDQHDTELHADRQASGEERQHAFGGRAGCDVEVLGRPAEQSIAHATAGEQRLVAGIAQSVHDAGGFVASGARHSAVHADTRRRDGSIDRARARPRGLFGASGRGEPTDRLVRLAPPWHVETMRAALVVALLLVLEAAAAAHMVVLPASSETGGWERYSLLVPTEKASPTVRVELRLPAGVEIIAIEAKPGWQAAHDALPIGAAKVRWEGGRIPSGQMVSFDFMAWNPRTPRTLTWVATQWYEDGSSDRWGGDGDAEHHASTTVLRAGKTQRDTHHPHADVGHHHGDAGAGKKHE